MIRIPPRCYDDIIHLPRPEAPWRTRMSPLSRAAQFAPFAALSGFESSIDETTHRVSTAPDPSQGEDPFLDEALYEADPPHFE